MPEVEKPAKPRHNKIGSIASGSFRHFRVLLAWLSLAIKRLLSAGKLFENIAFATFVVVIVILVASCVALLKRQFSPAPQILIGSFVVVSPDQKTQGDIALGTTVANMVSDSLDEIIGAGVTYKGNSYSSQQQLFRPIEMPQIPVSRPFDFQLKGISLSQVITVWDLIRHRQLHISGELLPAKGANTSSPTKWVLQTRLTAEHTITWTSEPFAMEEGALRAVVYDMALRIMTSINPEIAGRYYLDQRDYRNASLTFSQWLETDPNNPAPNLWLSRSLAMNHDFEGAENFANRAYSEIPPESWNLLANRRNKKYKEQSLIVMGYSEQNLHDVSEAADKYRQAGENGNVGALNNLGDLERGELQKPDQAITDLQTAITLEPSYVGARVNKARAFRDEGKFNDASDELKRVLAIDPFFQDAMQEYVDLQWSLHNTKEAAFYCRRWIRPMAIGEMPNKANGATFGLCVAAENEEAVPDIPLIGTYLQMLSPATAEPLRRIKLGQIATKLCDPKNPLPNNAEHPALEQEDGLNAIALLLKNEKPDSLTGRCVQASERKSATVPTVLPSMINSVVRAKPIEKRGSGD